jgi:hypothetical protein
LVAADADQAREQWLAVFARDRADLGVAHAAARAAGEAARYATPRPLDAVLAELHAAWTEQQRCADLLAHQLSEREALCATAARHAESTQRLAVLEADCAEAATRVASARQLAEDSGELVGAGTDRIRDTLLARWDGEREAARQAAQTVLDGPGRFGFRRAAVARAGEQLTGWHATWAPHLQGLPADNARLVRLAAGPGDPDAVRSVLEVAARRAAEAAHPEHAALTAAADAAERDHARARWERDSARRGHDNDYGTTDQADYLRQLADTERALAGTRQQLTDLRARITTLQADPALRAQPAERLQQESQAWRTHRDAAQRAARTPPRPTAGTEPTMHRPRPEDLRYLGYLQHRPGPGRGVGR